MKIKVVFTRLMILLMICCIAFAGCAKKSNHKKTEGTSEGSSEEQIKPVALVIIAGRHANAKMYSEKMIKQASDYMKKTFVTTHNNDGYTATAQISVIICDGKPEKVDTIVDGKDILTYTSGNFAELNEQKGALVNELTDFLLSDELKSNDAEVDLLSAISKAQNILESYPDSEHHILILDTGITTAGALNMNKINIMERSTDEIIESISDAIPHLDGTYITFAGLGNVADPQSEIRSIQGQNKLEELWTAILKYGNAELTSQLIYNDSENTAIMAYSESNLNSYKEVSAVSFYNSTDDGVEPNPVVIQHEEKAEDATITVCLQTADLGGFEPDRAEFSNIDTAIHTLNTLSDDLSKFLSGTDYKLYVVGSIARVEPGDAKRTSHVSQERAEAVAELLIKKYDVPQDRIVTIDAGMTKFSWRNADEFPNGSKTQVDSEAQKNRVVAIISENSSLVDELKENGYVQ